MPHVLLLVTTLWWNSYSNVLLRWTYYGDYSNKWLYAIMSLCQSDRGLAVGVSAYMYIATSLWGGDYFNISNAIGTKWNICKKLEEVFMYNTVVPSQSTQPRVMYFWTMCQSATGVIMHRSSKFQAPPNVVDFLWSCEGVYHKQEVCFFCFLGQIVTWQNIPKVLD